MKNEDLMEHKEPPPSLMDERKDLRDIPLNNPWDNPPGNQSVTAEFLRLVGESDYTEEQKKLVIRTGMAALGIGDEDEDPYLLH